MSPWLTGNVHVVLILSLIDLFSYVCKLPIVDHVMLSREFFLYVSENYSFIFTRICLNLKEIILKGTITWSTLGQQTNEAKEVYWEIEPNLYLNTVKNYSAKNYLLIVTKI